MKPPVGRTTAVDEKIVTDYLPLVRQIARRYSRASGVSLEDLIQVGAVGLLKAVKGFDAQRCKNATLHGYAALFIKGEISHYLRDQASLVRTPRRLFDAGNKLSRAEEALKTECGRSPTLDELSMRSGLSVEEVLDILQARDACTFYQSLDGPASGEDLDESAPLAETIADERHIGAIERAEMREAIAQSLKNLSAKSRQIIECVYFEDLSQKETARLVGWSEMKVSRAVRAGLRKLKELLLTEIF